ncbi:hypothetical protein D0Z07_3585 [Hyphodiscus hymeniophilus]|uniref:DUF3824 domain-containing protein n=1 Tax=Hyphodiscus hymeniophilus TaxID=353542 RepID=A0A9P6VKY9_9HELO|nr:hypothetical protein D0Z07_3585 [Hyphodiscus hymeniophilus]
MSAVDPYEYDEPRRHRSSRHKDRRDDREPRYVETQETYIRGPAGAPLAPDPPYATSRTTDLMRRPDRQDSDLSIEEVRRDFPPPGAAGYVQQRSMVRDDRYGPPVRSRSAERGAYLDPRDERRSRKSTTYEERTTEPRRRSLSRNQKIIAGVAGAALAVGSKELFDRRKAHGQPVSRNALQTAAIGAAGAFAGYEATELYAKHAGGKEEKTKTHVAHRGRNGEVAEYYSSDEEPEEKPKKSRRKSIVEGALGLAGLGAAAKAAGGGRDKSRSRRGSPDSFTSRRSGRSRSRGGRGKSPEGAAKFQQAAKAALLAGATEAFRVRKEPGGWGGAKGKRILTAAIGAGSIDAAADRDPDHKSKRHILEAVVGGLAGNRLINGSRSNVEDDNRSRRGSSRSRSRGPSGGGGGAGLAALATAGLGALAAKKFSDRSRSRSRGGDRRRRDSPDSYDSRSPSPDRRHKRSKSVTDYARKGLAALGIGEAAGAADDHDRRRSEVVEETHVHRSSRRRRSPDDDYDDRRGSTRDGGYARDRGDPYGDPRYADSRSSVGGGSTRNGGGRRSDARAKDGRKNKRIAEGKQDPSDSESSLGSSSGDEKRIKKMKGKQLITAGLATVATIHAAHNIYQSMEKREARHKAVQEGEMTPEEARKLKAKATLQDAASVGIAALGIKGAISEIKEANEMRHETREFREKKEERHKKRLERQKKLKEGGSGGGRRRPNDADPRYNDGPRYLDGNPYSAGALPAPPVGYNGR